MPTVGYCHDCARWVYVGPDWSCPNGHPAARVNGWYDSETREPLTPPAAKVESAAAATSGADVAPAGTRAAFLADLMRTISQSHAYVVAWGPDTDMTIASNPVNSMWGAGAGKTEYAGALKVVEPERTVCFWESLTQDTGAPASETGVAGDDPSGAKRAAAIGPGSTSWEWGFGTLRGVVEETAARHGFSVRVVLDRQAALW